jgi:hypothetical protein
MTDQTGPKRTHHQRQRDRQEIADWYCQGLTQAAIAERINADDEREYNLSQQTISNDIRAIQAAWLKSSLRDFDEMRAEQLGKVDRLEREYWRGWERSCKDAETLVRKQKGAVKKYQDEQSGQFVAERPAEQQQTSKGQAGDPRFLAGVKDCIDRRCKLLGLDAPIRQDITSDGKPILQRVKGFDDV